MSGSCSRINGVCLFQALGGDSLLVLQWERSRGATRRAKTAATSHWVMTELTPSCTLIIRHQWLLVLSLQTSGITNSILCSESYIPYQKYKSVIFLHSFPGFTQTALQIFSIKNFLGAVWQRQSCVWGIGLLVWCICYSYGPQRKWMWSFPSKLPCEYNSKINYKNYHTIPHTDLTIVIHFALYYSVIDSVLGILSY